MMDDESSIEMGPLVEFWGVELSGKCKSVTWPGSEEDFEPDVTVRLELRQACLGARAKAGERNVVELTAEDEEGDKATHSIVSLTVGGTEQSPLFLDITPPVTFNLAAGSGPIHIVGNVYTELGEFPSDDEESDEDDEFSNNEAVRSRKRAADSPPRKLAKTRKRVKENGDGKDTLLENERGVDEEEEEESDEEDESEEESEHEKDDKPPQKPALVAKPRAKPVQKSTKSAALSKTPQPPQPPKASKMSGKTSFSAPNTPEKTKSAKKGSSKLPMNMEDMKEKLKKTPNLPKKLDKFNSYVQQNFKVTDDKVKKRLWEFAQKVRVTK